MLKLLGSLVIGASLAACGPTGPVAGPPTATVAQLIASLPPTPVATASPPAIATAPTTAPSEGPAPARSAAPDPATEAPAPSPTVAVTSVPSIRPVSSPPPTPTPAARNEGQELRVDLPRAFPTFVGEAGGTPLVLNGDRWTLDQVTLTGSDIRCTARATAPGVLGQCVAVRILTGRALLANGREYALAFGGELIARFTATGIRQATPHVMGATATQYTLTVSFDRPMSHAGDCGSTSWDFRLPGTIEHLRAGTGFPAAPGSYRSSDPGYQDLLTAFVSEAKLSPDCRTVVFGSGWGATVGTFEVGVAGVMDVDGNLVEPRTITVTVADEGPPTLRFAELELQTADRKMIRVAYSEAMDQGSVTDPARYQLNGAPLPAGTGIECELASCTWVRLTFGPRVFVYGAPNTITIIGVEDTAGNLMSPDIVTSGTFEVR